MQFSDAVKTLFTVVQETGMEGLESKRRKSALSSQIPKSTKIPPILRWARMAQKITRQSSEGESEGNALDSEVYFKNTEDSVEVLRSNSDSSAQRTGMGIFLLLEGNRPF